jgi:pilus assembly protein Flp/PilA
MPMPSLLHYYLRREDGGAVMIEYALIAALISIVIIGGLSTIGQTISNNFFGPVVSAL